MSYHDDDEHDVGGAGAARYVNAAGILTRDGHGAIKLFASQGLIQDDECTLSERQAREAFREWSWGRERGFDVQLLADTEVFQRVLESAGIPTVEQSDDDCEYNHVYRARVRDALGFQRFEPSFETPDVRYLVEPLLVEGSVNMFVALPETLKTWTALSLAVAVSRGERWLGRYKTRCVRVAHADYEMGPIETQRRFEMQGADERIFWRSFPSLQITNPRFWQHEIPKLRAGLFCADSLSAGSSTDLPETDARYAEPLTYAARLAAEHGTTTLFLHHAPKGADVRRPESLFRGTGAIRSKVDSAYYFERLADGPSGQPRARVSCVKSRKGIAPEPFEIQLSDARGLELVGAEPPRHEDNALAIEERVYQAIIGRGGRASVRDVTADLGVHRTRVATARDNLIHTGRIEVIGKGRAMTLVALKIGSHGT